MIHRWLSLLGHHLMMFLFRRKKTSELSSVFFTGVSVSVRDLHRLSFAFQLGIPSTASTPSATMQLTSRLWRYCFPSLCLCKKSSVVHLRFCIWARGMVVSVSWGCEFTVKGCIALDWLSEECWRTHSLSYLTWFLSKPIHSDPHPLPYKLPLQRVCYETIQIWER